MSKQSFKVDDWVTASDDHPFCPPTHTFQVTQSNIEFANKKGWKWEPHPGNWCWFWQETSHPILDRFDSFECDGSYISKNTHNNRQCWDYCEPFTNQLPTKLKD